MNCVKKQMLYITLLSGILFLLFSCSGQNKQQNVATSTDKKDTDAVLSAVSEAPTEKSPDDDRIYYFKDLKEMRETPIMKGSPKEYFRKNNKYKEWDADNPQKVFIEYIVEKDGTASNIEIKESCGNKELDNEAVRLIKEAIFLPGTDFNGKPIRCGNTMIYVFFPPQ